MHYKLLPNLFLISRRGIKCSHMPFFDGTKVYDHLQYPTTKINSEENLAADFVQNMVFRCPEYDESKSCCIRMHFQRNPGSSICTKNGIFGLSSPMTLHSCRISEKFFLGLEI